MKHKFSIGVDVGGSHISCAIYNLTTKKLDLNTVASCDMDNEGSKESIIDSFTKLLLPVIKKIGYENLEGVGIAMPGPFNYNTGVALFTGENAKFGNLKDVNLTEELKASLNLPELNIRYINDATAFSIGEYVAGGLQGSDKAIAGTLGTGFGSSFLENGIPVIKDNRVAEGGCLWHVPFKDGIADDYFSTRGMIKRYFDLSGVKVSGVKEIADKAPNDELAAKAFNQMGEDLGEFLSTWVKKFDADTILLGGSISKAFNLFKTSLNNTFKNSGLNVSVTSTKLGEDAAFVGGAVLFDNDFWKNIQPLLQYM